MSSSPYMGSKAGSFVGKSIVFEVSEPKAKCESVSIFFLSSAMGGGGKRGPGMYLEHLVPIIIKWEMRNGDRF